MIDYSRLNEAQRLAVTHGEGPLLLLAGPGSGKTFTITQRILYLLEQGIAPEEILVITFTKDAAASMQQRFRKISPTNLPVNFGTFHSVFYHMLKTSNFVRTENLLNNSQKKKLLIPILKEYSKEILQEDTAAVLSAMSYYKNTLSLENAVKKTPKDWQKNFTDIFERYEKARVNTGAVDFDDMVCECRRMLTEDPKMRQYWQKRFAHILIDEFQDINPIQYETVKLLSKPPHNLFAVGDDDQAIYGFRGAQPDCLKRFAKEYDARQLLLNINYRSCREIVDASAKVIKENKNRFQKEIQPFSEDKALDGQSPVSVKAFSNKDSQYEYLIQHTGELQGSCAVLFRTNALMQGIAARLRRAGVPYIMKEKVQSIYEHFIFRDIMSYLLLASGKWSREKFIYICNRPSRYINREALGSGNSLQEVKRYYADEPKTLAALELMEKQLSYIGGISTKLAVTYICKAVGYEKYLRAQSKGHPEKWLEWHEMLEWVKADAERFENVEDWLMFQEEYNESLKQKGAQEKKEQQSQSPQNQAGHHQGKEELYLMTVHGSKGLEFDHVIIPDCNERVFPQGSLIDVDTCEEERRIFYVAMTRAAKSLELLYINDPNAGSRLPSRFLNPLLKV